MAGQVLQVVLVPSVLGRGQERVGLLWHMLEGWLSTGPLGPVAQYDCQRLAAVQLSLRSADLHCSLSHRLLAAAAALKLCALGVVTPGILSRDSSRRWRGGGAALLIRIILLCSAILISADGGELGVAGRISSHRRRRLLSWAGFSQA